MGESERPKWRLHIMDQSWADGRLTERFREFSKRRDLGLDFPNRSEILQAPRQLRCRYAGQILERYGHYNTQSHGFVTWDLAVRRLTA